MNKNLIKVLGEMKGITKKVILKHPVTVLASEAKDIYAHIDCSVLDENEFPEIGLNGSLDKYLSLFNMFDDNRTVSYDGDTINITSGDITTSFISDKIALMDEYNIPAEQFARTEMITSVSTFDLTVDDIKKIKDASGIFNDLTEIIIKSVDSDVSISLGETNKYNARNNSFKIRKNTQTTKDFEVKIPVENLKKLPESEYTFEVKYNEQRNGYRILLTNKNVSSLKFILTVII